MRIIPYLVEWLILSSSRNSQTSVAFLPLIIKSSQSDSFSLSLSFNQVIDESLQLQIKVSNFSVYKFLRVEFPLVLFVTLISK